MGHSEVHRHVDRGDVFSRRGDVRFRIVVDEAVVLRQEAAEVLVLNEVGGRILELLDGERTVGDVVDEISSEFEVDESTRLADETSAFIAELVEAGIVTPAARSVSGTSEVGE